MVSIEQLHERLVSQIHGSTGQSRRKLANNTYGEIFGELVTIVYHSTAVATIWPHTATYRTGGWWTYTTKERINWYLPQGWRLYSVESIWYLSAYGARQSRFYDEITLHDRDGKVVVDMPQLDDPDADLRKAINRYAALYTDEKLTELVDEAIESGTNGDCLFCQFGHEAPVGGDHLLMHVAEGYVMVTLAANAVKRAGYKPEIYVRGMASDSRWHDGTTIRRSIRKMLKAELLNRGFDLAAALEEVNA